MTLSLRRAGFLSWCQRYSRFLIAAPWEPSLFVRMERSRKQGRFYGETDQRWDMDATMIHLNQNTVISEKWIIAQQHVYLSERSFFAASTDSMSVIFQLTMKILIFVWASATVAIK